MSNIKELEEFDYLNFCREYIKIDLNDGEFNDDPQFSKIIYGNIESMTGTLTFLKWLKNCDDRQIIEYINQNNFSFIIKRNTIKCDLPVDFILSDVKKRAFINSAVKEFLITKIISHHPAGIQAYDFKVTYLQKKHWLVTEFLMEKPGITLTEFINKPSVNFNFVKYFTQLSSLMQRLEEIQIFYGDVKCNNCLVDAKGNFRIIDCDVSRAEGYFSTDTIVTTNKILGFSEGFMSPEICDHFHKAQGLNSNSISIMPWRADIYSYGIVGLYIFGAINQSERNHINVLDNYKINSQKHQFIIDKCKQVECGDESLSEKMQYLLEVCLSYDPKMRITFKQNHTIMLKIQDKDYDLKKLQQEVEDYRNINQGFFTKNLFQKDDKESLIIKLNEIMYRNLILEDELHKLKIEKMENLVYEFNREQFIYESAETLKKILENFKEKDIRLLKNILKDEKEKVEFFAHSEDLFKSYGSNSSIKITEFSQVVHFIKEILDDNKMLHDENSKLKNELSFQEDSSIEKFDIDAKPSKNSPKVVKQTDILKLKDYLGQLTPKNLKGGILSRIYKPFFWYLSNMELSKNEILEVLKFGSKSNTLQGIYFFKNKNFDEECGKAYETFILENNSMFGIDLSFLNFSKQQKFNIISLAKQKKSNIKVAIVEEEALSNEEAKQFTKSIGWELNNKQSNYLKKYSER